MLILIVLLWGVVGTSGFIYWWTKDYDLDTGCVGLSFAASFLGPLTWLIGFIIHGEPRKPKTRKVLIKKRGH